MKITEPAPAKINLALHVRARRSDGYHDIETLFAFCRDGDVLTMNRAESTSLLITGPFAGGLSADRDNLVLAAAAAFQATYSTHRGYALTLDKRLPIASGIGGGSADAAATLRLLARHHGTPLDHQALALCAASLGSDVPACLMGRTAIGTGRGEALMPVEGLAGTPALLVNPGVAVSTAAVFKTWDGVDRGPLPSGSAREIALGGRNDLEASATALCPAIAEVLAALRGTDAWLVRMSGSGATCFALFDDETGRDAAAAAMASAHPDWWTLSSVLT